MATVTPDLEEHEEQNAKKAVKPIRKPRRVVRRRHEDSAPSNQTYQSQSTSTRRTTQRRFVRTRPKRNLAASISAVLCLTVIGVASVAALNEQGYSVASFIDGKKNNQRTSSVQRLAKQTQAAIIKEQQRGNSLRLQQKANQWNERWAQFVGKQITTQFPVLSVSESGVIVLTTSPYTLNSDAHLKNEFEGKRPWLHFAFNRGMPTLTKFGDLGSQWEAMFMNGQRLAIGQQISRSRAIKLQKGDKLSVTGVVQSARAGPTVVLLLKDVHAVGDERLFTLSQEKAKLEEQLRAQRRPQRNRFTTLRR